MQEIQEMLVWSLGQEDFLEKDMVTHPNNLAQRIPMESGVRSTEWLSSDTQAQKHNTI